METIKLKVTSKVIASNQAQITISKPSESLKNVLKNCNKNNRISFTFYDAFTLEVGDTYAIWRSHNKNPEFFDHLFKLLIEEPDTEFTFNCKVTN